jgi:hypothetical protein
MSSLTQLHAIEPDLFMRLRRQRYLPRLVDYIQWPHADAELGLPAQPPFRSCVLDKAWPHFEPFLTQVAPAIWDALRAYAHLIAPKTLDAAYWEPLETAWCLGAVDHALCPPMNGIATQPVNAGLTIILPEGREAVAALLAQRAAQRMRSAEAWYDGDDELFDTGTLNYTIRYFCEWLDFATQAVYPAGKVILRVSD